MARLSGSRARTSKVEYVLAQKQLRHHVCHWPDCYEQIPPAMWGCKKHWFMLPLPLRNKIWATYVPGQEQRMDPSQRYLTVARDVQRWIQENYIAPKKSR